MSNPPATDPNPMASLFAALNKQEPRATMVAARQRLAALVSPQGPIAKGEDAGGSSYPSEDNLVRAAARLAPQTTPDLVGSWLAAALEVDEIGSTASVAEAGEGVWSVRVRFTSLPDAADWRREISLAELRAASGDPLARMRGEAAAWFRERSAATASAKLPAAPAKLLG